MPYERPPLSGEPSARKEQDNEANKISEKEKEAKCRLNDPLEKGFAKGIPAPIERGAKCNEKTREVKPKGKQVQKNKPNITKKEK